MALRNQKARIKKHVALINANLGRAFDKIEKVTFKEMIEVGFDIEADAKKMAPVVTGNLRGSGFTIFTKGEIPAADIKDTKEKEIYNTVASVNQNTVNSLGRGVKAVIVGFSASYGKYVHGNPNAGKSQLPGTSDVGGWLFLTKSVQKHKNRLLRRMAKAGRIK